LIVDDEEEICLLLAKYLTLLGHRVHHVLSGEDAIRIVRQQRFDIVFLDFVMPGIPASNVAVEIAKTTPATKTVLMSGRIMNKTSLNGLSKNVACFIEKPFSFEKIREAIGSMEGKK
jgi:DNA-binding NtrC family response regulator